MQISNLLSSIAQLLWPVVVAVLVIVLLPVIRGLIKGSDSVNLEVGGAKISVQRAAEDIRKLINDLQDRLNAIEGRMPSQDAQEAGKATFLPRPSKILWVDDGPNANVYERARVKDAGYELLQAESTAVAQRILASDGPMQLIVTDMARVEAGSYNMTAGLDLIKGLRKANDLTPVVVYSSRRSLAPVLDDLQKLTNVSYTTSPTELIGLIGVSDMNHISDSPPS
jgi:CheY-like chemotaxis protein